ncbi:SU10 major capsid protein, partial [Bacillus cereus]
IIDANRITIRPLVTREFSHEFLGKKGDYMKGMLVGEYTLEMLQEAAHAKIVGLGDLEELPTAPATRKAASK